MSQDLPNSQDANQAKAPDQPDDGVVKRKRRRRWPWVLLALFLILLLLVAMAPTIASTGAVRSMILGQVNQNLNGRVDITNWSLGWFSKTSVDGIKVYDEQNVLVLDVPRVKLGVSLLDLAKGNFALGDDNVIDVASFIVNVDAAGRTNLERLPKTKPSPKPATSDDTKLPDLSGKFTVNFQGTVKSDVDQAKPVIVHVDPSTAIVSIPNINQPIQSDVKLAYRVGEGEQSMIETSGTIHAIRNNILDPMKLTAAQKVSLKSVNLAAAEPFLKALGPDTKLAGVMNGGIDVKADGLSSVATNGTIEIKNLLFAGGPIGADTFKTETISIPVNITSTQVDANTTLIKFENVGVKMAQANVSITGQVTQQALANLAEGKRPGSDGSITIIADVTDLKDIAQQLKNTLKLQEGVAITGGKIHEQIDIKFDKEKVTLAQNLVADAKGTRNAQPIVLQPITVNASASAIPTGKPMPDVRDIKLGIESTFASVKGGGESLAKIDINGNFDLAKLKTELSQFADLGNAELSGAGEFKVMTSGDLTDQSKPIVASTYVSLSDADRKSILMELDASAKVVLANFAVPWFEVKKCNVMSLPRLQQQYGALMPALAEQKIRIESGALYATAAGSFDGKTLGLSKPASLSVPTLTVTQDGRPLLTREIVRASANGSISINDGIAGNLSDLSLTTESKMVTVTKSGGAPLEFRMKGGAIQGNGAVTLAADLSKLAAVGQAFSGIAPADQITVTTGQLDGTLTLAKTDQTKVNFDAKISQLAVARQSKSYSFDKQTPVSLKVIANVIGTDSIESINITELAGDLRVASLTMPDKIVMKLSDKEPTYQGSVKLIGKLEDVAPLLAVIQGADALPYAGAYQLDQKLNTAAGKTTLAGAVDVNNFQVLDASRKPVFNEPQIAVRNDIDVDFKEQKLAVQTLTVDMPKSQAVALSVSKGGGINFWADKREIRPNTKVDLTYDLAKLWTIVYPMLSAEQQASYKDVKVVGKHTKTFTLKGSIPDKPTFNESLKFLDADGGFAVDSIDAMGLNVAKLEPNVKVRKGVLTIEAKPAVANEGKLDLNGIVVDPTQTEMTLTIPKKRILQDVKLNPVLARSIGKYAGLVMSNASHATGLLDFTAIECNQVSLAALLREKNSSTARFDYSVRDLDLDGPVPSALGKLMDLGGKGFQGGIPSTSLIIGNGQVKTDMTLVLKKEVEDRSGKMALRDVPLNFNGGVGFEKLDLRDFIVTLPRDLVVRAVPRDLRQFVPEQIKVPITGTPDKFDVKFDEAVKKTIGQANPLERIFK